MAATLTIRDESTAGDRSEPVILSFPTEEMTIREIIRERVYQEVDDFNRRRVTQSARRMLVEPSEAERLLAAAPKAPSPIDWRPKFEAACRAFEQSRYLVLVGDRQAKSLDERVRIERGVEVIFLRIVPLIGG